jgi:cell migration-inducing and hyaluronan-binding protein
MLTAVSKNKAGERGVKSVRFRITNGAQSRAAPAPASASTQATALPPGPTPMGQLWSDPMTWGGMLPAEGAEVIVPVGQTIVMDVDPPPLRSLQIDGTLVFDNRDLSLQADWIMVHGRLEIGTAEQPFRHRATITMIGDDPSEDIMGMGSNVFGVMGGTLDIHGERRGPSWTRLAQTAEPGASWIELEQPVNWRPGDRIVIASTDFDPLQAEEMTVVSVIDTVVVLDKPLKYRHWGEAQEFSGMKIDTRAEVGLLSRNIVVQGAEASEETRFGGHMMIMQGSTARIDSAEFFRMGQLGEKGRYPVHFHMAGYMMGSYVNNNSIHHSHSRCLTIHGSHQVLVQNNVAYDTYGHCYFIEDGIETKNVLEGNLGLVTRQPPMENALLETDMAPATFWITNPDNIIRNNVAAGSQGHGFWYALPEHPTGPSATDQVTPREMGVMEFSGNVAHSNIKQMHDFGSGTGLRVDEHLDGRAVFEEFTGYKNQSFGMWMLYKPQITGARLADNRVGVLAIDGVVEDSLIVGLSDNSDPKVGVPIGPGDYLDAPLLGMMMYNGHIHTKRVAFVNFKDYKSPEGHMHHAGGVGLLESRDWNDYPLASIEGSRFVNATPVYLRPYIEAARDSTRTFVLEDRDGSVSGSGQPGSVVLNHPLQLTPECTPLAHNQTSVCPMQNRYVSFEMGNWDGEAPHMDMSPVNLTRDDGVSAAISSFVVPYPDGNGASGARAHLPANRNYAISTGITTPQHMSLSLHSGQMGDWMQLSIPYPHEKLFVYQDKNYGQPLPAAESLEALVMSQSSAYVLVNGTLHVKLVANSDFDVCAAEGCP